MGYKDREKQRQFNREWRASRRQAWLDENGPCVQCGSNQDLEVDHIDPELKVTHNIWSWSEERRLAELSKCQVLCAECHKKKTYAQRKRRAVHGSDCMYNYHGCRCDLCRQYQSARMEKYNRRKSNLDFSTGVQLGCFS